MSDDPGHQTKMAAITKNRKYGKKSIKNHLLWDCWANWAQTIVEWSSDGPLSELCLMAPVRQPRWSPLLKIRKFAKQSLKNYLLWNCWANWAQTMVEWSLGDPLSEVCPTTRLPAKISAITKNRKFGKKSLKNDLLWNRWVKWAQTMVKWSSLRNVSDDPGRQPRWPLLLKIENHLKMISSETTGPVGRKLWWNGL